MDSDTLQLAREIIERDPFANRLGIRLLELGQGYSKTCMRVTEDMANFHGTTHGGAIFALADAAFAAAGNSQGRVGIALEVTISYLSATTPGGVIFAEAQVEHESRKTGLYRLTVTDEEGKLIASCHALAYLKDKR